MTRLLLAAAFLAAAFAAWSWHPRDDVPGVVRGDVRGGGGVLTVNGIGGPLPDGWRVMQSRTVGGSVFYHVECDCGFRLRGTATLGQLLDHICAA